MGCDRAGCGCLEGKKRRRKEGKKLGTGFPASCLSTFSRSCVLPFLLSALALGPICGCESGRDNSGMANAYFLDRNKDLGALGRVALVEMDNLSGYPQISAEMTDAFYLEIQKQQIFGLVVVRQDDPAWRSLQENVDSLQAMRQLAVMRESLRSNGLLLGTITQYQPYPHMVISLRLKLLDLTDGQLVWGVEQVWDSTDKAVQKRIQKYYKQQLRSEHTPLSEELVVVSSLNFCKFVANEVASTLRRPEEP